MSKFPFRALAALCAGAALASIAPATAVAQSGPIPIGVVVALTGPLAVIGLPERDGIQLAFKQINAAGGIKGRPLEAILEDDASSPDVAVSKTNNLVFNHKVKAIIGATGIASTVAMGGLTAPRKLPQISFSGLGPAVERERTCVFHLTPAQELNARSLLEYATKALKAKNIAVLLEAGFGTAVFSSMKALGPDYGVEFVAVEKYEIGATDASTQVAKMRAANPDVILVAGSSPTPFRSVKQMKVAVPVVAAHPAAPYDTVKAMGDGAQGVVFADFLVAEDPLPSQKAFVDAFQKEYGRLPKNFDAAGYDSVQMLARALEKVGPEASSEHLCNALRAPYQGAMTSFDLSAPDMGGLKTSNFVYSTYANGKFSRLPFRINP
jgi:branched-chain amino acid transport system substrate-binding protein